MKRFAVLGITAIWCAGLAALCAALAGSAGPVPWDGTSAAAQDQAMAGLTPTWLWGGTASLIAADGAVGYVARTTAVDVIDLAGSPPRAISRRLFADHVTALAATPGRLYVASGSLLMVFDAGRPARLSEVGRWTLPSGPAGLPRRISAIAAASGTVWLSVGAAVAPYDGSALVAVDVRDPERPRSITELAVNPAHTAGRLWRAGDRLAVVTWGFAVNEPFTSHVSVFDVRDPLTARLVGRAGAFNPIRAGAIRGDFLFVAVDFSPQMRHLGVEATAGIRVIDIAGPEGPRLVGRWDTGEKVSGMTLLGDRALVTVPGPRCIVLDTTDGLPKESGSVPCARAPGFGFTGSSVESTGLLLVAAYTHGWEAWAWPDNDPVLLARSGDGRPAWDVASDGQRLLVFDGDAVWLLARDGAGGLSETELPIEDIRAFLAIGARESALALSSDRAIVAGWAGMVVFDVAASPPRRLGQLAWGPSPLYAQPRVATLVGEFAVLASPWVVRGLALVDLSDPMRPVRRTTPWDDLPAWDVTVDQGRIYVGSGSRLYVFRPGGPDGLTLLGEAHIETPDGGEQDVRAVAVKGGRAVIGGDRYAAVLDVRDPANIRTIAEHELEGVVGDLAWIGEDVVAAGGSNNLRLMLLRGDNAGVVNELRMLSDTYGLAVIDELVYVAEDFNGLAAYRPWRLPDGWRADYRLALPWLAP